MSDCTNANKTLFKKRQLFFLLLHMKNQLIKDRKFKMAAAIEAPSTWRPSSSSFSSSGRPPREPGPPRPPGPPPSSPPPPPSRTWRRAQRYPPPTSSECCDRHQTQTRRKCRPF